MKDFYNKYSFMINPYQLRKFEYQIHNPGDRFNVVPWVHVPIGEDSTAIYPAKMEKYLDYDGDDLIFPFKLQSQKLK
jgi:hypothetical protein